MVDNRTGEVSYFASYPHLSIMYHVAHLIPTEDSDFVQLARKRYLGNDFSMV